VNGTETPARKGRPRIEDRAKTIEAKKRPTVRSAGGRVRALRPRFQRRH
jgi:hypothetical protein